MGVESSAPNERMPSAAAPWRRVLAWGAALLALGLTFMAYLQPELVVDLANRLWSCF